MNDKWIMSIFIIGVILIIAAFVVAIIHDGERTEWLQTHCKKIGQISSSSNFGMGLTNKGMAPVIIMNSGKTGWMCDDGLQYWE